MRAVLAFVVAGFALLATASAYAAPDLRPQIFNVNVGITNVDPGDVVEGCAGGATNRRLVRFSLLSHNDGPDDLNIGNPGCPNCTANPGAACSNPLFVCSTAHGHAHFESFVLPELLDSNGAVVAQGHKFGFCLLDTVCSEPPGSAFTCSNQGIHAGCYDLYASGLPCQYVDITDAGLAAGMYTLRITIDPQNAIAEADETDNTVTVPVQIDPPPPNCPDGTLDAGEACDDGNANAGDGCDPECRVEACYVCQDAPSECTVDVRCIRCQRTVTRATARFAATRGDLVTDCEVARVKGRHDDPCPDPSGPAGSYGRRAADKIARAESKLRAGIATKCGGDDGICGGDLSNEVTPSELDFPAPCPSFGGNLEFDCTAPLNDCNDLASCILCVDETATDLAATRTFGSLLPNGPQRCQRTIGAVTQKLLAAELSAIESCWDARVRGKHADECPDPSAPIGSAARRAADRIDRARAKHASTICRACGGPDRVCGGSDDANPITEVGFPAECDDVHVHGGMECGGPIATLSDVIECTRCVSDLEAQCLSSLPVPSLTEYPHDCADF